MVPTRTLRLGSSVLNRPISTPGHTLPLNRKLSSSLSTASQSTSAATPRRNPQFAARGISVFTFDQRGFGKTALDAENKSPSSAYGKTTGEHQMDDIHWAIEHAKKEFPGLPVFLRGHSMGRRRGAEFSRPQDLSHDAKYNEMCRNDSLSKLQGTLRGLTDMLNWGDEVAGVNYTKWPKTLPITSHSAAKDFHDKIVSDDKNMIIYPDGFHELVQEPAHTEKLAQRRDCLD
ncbi:hypothetical protein B0H14DRAFT_3763816 [Mycena olivaceomarginata]|nr:hypothetical protein B0H14DRAFT_3763816 [Mycena olivaceomarginata]